MSRSRLETVVRVGELRERIARGRVGVARRDANDRLTARSAAALRLDELAADPPRAAAAFVDHRRVLDGGVRALAGAEAALSSARDDVVHALAGWEAAAQRLEGVHRLDERLAAADDVLRNRREAAETDDLNVVRWRRRHDHPAQPDRRLDELS